jgi:hypothetical protein
MRTLPTGRVCYKVATAHERRLRRLLEYLTRRVFERGPMASWLEAVHYAVELELWARIGALSPADARDYARLRAKAREHIARDMTARPQPLR